MNEWKRYPYTAQWGDSRHFTFPACDGFNPNLGGSTYLLDGFLQGRSTDRRYAFLSLFADLRFFWKRVRASFFTFALFDCDQGQYGTCTDYDYPRPPLVRQRHKLEMVSGRLGLHYRGGAAEGRWDSLMQSSDSFRPFAWEVELRGIDQHGKSMQLELVIEAQRPPAPLGGRELGGEVMFFGAERTHSYFQSGLLMRGHLQWGDVAEDVEGDVGWIDRQWSDQPFDRHQDLRSSRYRSEWRVLQFDNGWDMSCTQQYLRPLRNALVPWSGMSAQGPEPNFELEATHRFELTVPEFVRSPGQPRARAAASEGPCYFPSRYRLQVPEWDMDVESEPLVAAPAHGLPIEYWNGPVVIRGTFQGDKVLGLGFDQRSRPWSRDFELAEALRLSCNGLAKIDDNLRRMLSQRSWEIEALCLRGDRRAAARHYRQHLETLLAKMPETELARVAELANDLLTLLK